jgi:phosphoglycolate phosphatase-like HAD superfamily hydrolase
MESVYQHVLARKEALDQEGIELAVWRIHRRIGMSGGLFTNQLLRETGLDISVECVERLRRRHAAAYRKYADDMRPLLRTRELLAWLSDAQIPWAIATSGLMETAGLNLATLGVEPQRERAGFFCKKWGRGWMLALELAMRLLWPFSARPLCRTAPSRVRTP